MTTAAPDIRVSYGAGRQSPVRLVAQGLTDIWSRRRLARYLVQADLTKKGVDTLLGNIWWVMDPLLQMLVYVALITFVARGALRIDDFPLFVFAAILPWKWFSSAVNDAILSVVSRERIIKQVAFPKIILPVAATVGGIANFAFGLIPLVGLILIFYRDRLSWTLLLIPVIAVVQLVFTLGVSIVLGALNVFYRDVANVARHILRLWFYLSPALYSLDAISGILDEQPLIRLVFALNPFTYLFEAYRAVIYAGTLPPFAELGALLLVSIAVLAFCIYLFKRLEPAFAKVL
jgi:ABC-type polysaccharide/polyol phosphate export permease